MMVEKKTMDNALTVRDNQPSFGELSLPMSLRVVAEKDVYERVFSMAKHMANSPGLVGPHLLGNADACFSIILLSMDFKLNPYMVAKCTFSAGKVKDANGRWVPGNIGFEGKLINAIVNASGRCTRPVEVEYFGDWDKVTGKFTTKDSSKRDENDEPRKYTVATYQDRDEEGLGAIARLYMKGEIEPREFEFTLRQARPRNSTLWATDPKTQFRYTITRRAVNAVAPEILMGLPFDDDVQPQRHVGPDRAVDITPAATDPIFDVLDGVSTQGEADAGGAVADIATSDTKPEQSTVENDTPPALRAPNGNVMPKEELKAWSTLWTDAILEDDSNARETYASALADAAVLFEDSPQVVKHIEELSKWAARASREPTQTESRK